MNRGSYPSGLKHCGLFFLCVPILLLAALSSTSIAGLEVECGFGGHIKGNTWTPVVVSPVPGATGFDVYVMSVDGRSKPKPEAHFTGVFRSDLQGRGFALCKFSAGAGDKKLIRCVVTHPDGTVESKDVQPNFLNANDTLMLVLSDEPETFSFLGSVESGAGIVRVVACGVEDFPSCWQEMDGVNEVVIDGTNAYNTAAQRDVLEDWMVAGGTVLLTRRGVAHTRNRPDLDLFPEVTCSAVSGDTREYDTAVLGPLVGKRGAFISKVRALSLRTDLKYRILGAGNDTLVAGKDVGQGRVLALGVDWQDLMLTDRAAFEMVRYTLWSRLLDLCRPDRGTALDRSLVLPRQARAGYLVKPLGLFLLAYVILLGPVNWLILRKLRKLEYSTFTLPLGALVFAVGAFLIGVSLRTSESVLEEAEIVTFSSGHKAEVNGISGLLAPDSRPYRLTVTDPSFRIEEQGEESGYGGAGGERRPEDMITCSWDGGMSLSNVKVGTWRMRFFQTMAVTDLGGTLSATGRCSRTNLYGEVQSRLPFTLKDAYVIQRWNTKKIGDIPPGATKPFSVALLPPARAIFRPCPNCHRYHGEGGHITGEEPLPKEVEDLLQRSPAAVETAVVVGWQETQSSLVGIDRPACEATRRRLCVVPIDVRFDGPDLFVPATFVEELRLSSSSPSITSWRCSAIPYLLEVLDPAMLDEPESIRRRRESGSRIRDFEDERRYVHDFLLPFAGADVESSLLRIYWDAGESDPDRPATDMILSAYNWQDRKWEELRRAKIGEHTISVDAPGRFVRLPYPIVSLRVEPVIQDGTAYPSYNFLKVGYEGRRVDSAGRDAENP